MNGRIEYGGLAPVPREDRPLFHQLAGVEKLFVLLDVPADAVVPCDEADSFVAAGHIRDILIHYIGIYAARKEFSVRIVILDRQREGIEPALAFIRFFVCDDVLLQGKERLDVFRLHDALRCVFPPAVHLGIPDLVRFGLIALDAEHIELAADDERAQQRAENAETLPVPVKHAQRFSHERFRAEPADRRAEDHGKEQDRHLGRSADAALADVGAEDVGAGAEYGLQRQHRHAERSHGGKPPPEERAQRRNGDGLTRSLHPPVAEEDHRKTREDHARRGIDGCERDRMRIASHIVVGKIIDRREDRKLPAGASHAKEQELRYVPDHDLDPHKAVERDNVERRKHRRVSGEYRAERRETEERNVHQHHRDRRAQKIRGARRARAAIEQQAHEHRDNAWQDEQRQRCKHARNEKRLARHGQRRNVRRGGLAEHPAMDSNSHHHRRDRRGNDLTARQVAEDAIAHILAHFRKLGIEIPSAHERQEAEHRGVGRTDEPEAGERPFVYGLIKERSFGRHRPHLPARK